MSYSYSIPIGEPLEKEILDRGFDVKWFSDTKEGSISIEKKSNVINSISQVIIYEPHIILTISDYVPDFINALKVQIFHGFLSKKRPGNSGFAHFRIRGLFDLYCTQGPSSTNQFIKLKKKYKTFKVVETGWSKVDCLFPVKKPNTSKIPLIFIASTFTRKLSLAYDDDIFNEIKRLSKTGKYHFNMVLHPKIPYNIKIKWKGLSGNYFHFHETTNLSNLFKISDIMFSDTTSAIQEFLLLEKPVVAINHTFDFNYLINIYHENKIESSFDYALTYPKNILKNIKKFNDNLHPLKDGNSSKRVINESLICLFENKDSLLPKPLNFIRKFKIRRKLNYFSFKTYNNKYTIQPIKQKLKLSVLIITHNELKNIKDLIKNISFANEIIVVDSFSNDGTAEYLNSISNIKLYQNKFKSFSEQRNYAISLSKNDWILFMDADERLTNDLVNEIRGLKLNDDIYVAYKIFRNFFFKHTRIKYSGYQNDSVVRLFNKKYGNYSTKKLVHETLQIRGKTKTLKNRINHFSYSSYISFKNKMLLYAKIKGKEMKEKNKRITALHFLFKPPIRFLYHYLLRFGFLDGRRGLILAYLNSLYVFFRYYEFKKLKK